MHDADPVEFEFALRVRFEIPGVAMVAQGGGSVLWHFRRPILRVLGFMVALACAGVVVRLLMEVAVHPWARSFGLWPTLTGDWTGELITAGVSTPVYVEIRSDFAWRSDVRHSPFITGRLEWCDGTGAIREFDVSGDVENWRGTAFHLTLYRRDPARAGESPAELAGIWDGDTIEGRGTLVQHGPTATAEVTRGQATAAHAAPAITYMLRRSGRDVFLTACPRPGGAG